MKRIKWSIEELEELHRLCESGWEYEFPGYTWVATHLNAEFKNNRTTASIKYQDLKKWNILLNRK